MRNLAEKDSAKASDPTHAEPPAKKRKYGDAQLTALWKMATGGPEGRGPIYVDGKPEILVGYRNIMKMTDFAATWDLKTEGVRSAIGRMKNSS